MTNFLNDMEPRLGQSTKLRGPIGAGMYEHPDCFSFGTLQIHSTWAGIHTPIEHVRAEVARANTDDLRQGGDR